MLPPILDHRNAFRTTRARSQTWFVHRQRARGFTIIETAVAAALITLFLSSLFLLNSIVLRMLRSGNESATASQILQARAEQIRMSNWLDVTSSTYLPTLLDPKKQPYVRIDLAALTETISVGAYQLNTTVAPSYIYQRTPDGTIIQTGGTGAALPGSDCVQFVITEHWSGWGGRPRERTLNTLASTWGIGAQ